MKNRTSVTKQKVALIASVVSALAAATTPAYAHHDYPHMPIECSGHYLIGVGPGPTSGMTCTNDPYFDDYVMDTTNDVVAPDPEPTEPTTEPSPESTKPGRGPKEK